MKKRDIIRAWRDEEFRLSLSEEQRAQLPANPAGNVELADEDLRSASGGWPSLRPVLCPSLATCG
ncbi:MAG TPA: mersacidin/lichenicidin family type 2 lantibiotic [Thermoanaerobaculia bacterium]|nr:mersacidin/lichenicidin family type 2 lantibiotic [Thermoanaerobaculia bacterium]